MKNLFFLSFFLLLSSVIIAQPTIKGTVTDTETGETLVGANIVVKGTSIGTVTDINGFYTLKVEQSSIVLVASFVGYRPVEKSIQVKQESVNLNFKLATELEIDEVIIIADVARSRETPVAFSTLTPQKLQEEIAAQDIPMVLNSTPGVYATTEGGGDGDAQITIRGFSARNVGVLLDGVPVNDMESGQVYWSNWFGLDAVTRSIQVQRGLGASKLALPSVGGTINIMTKGLENKKEGNITQEIGTDGYIRTSFGYNTGKFGNGWGISIAGSYKRGDGWVEQTWTKGFFYYLKIDKKIGKHTLSASAYGAPQSHAQRSYMLTIQSYNADIAREIGVPEEDIKVIMPMGIKYNQHWGYLARTKDNPNAKSEPFSERVNQYHKPQITLKDSWVVNDKLFISNIAYLSIGNGGGVRAKSTPGLDTETRRMQFQNVYDGNLSVNSFYDPELLYSSNYMRRLVNSHRWFGFLSTVNYEMNEQNSFSGGIDFRYYKGIHYEEVYDLLGGDYAVYDYFSAVWDYDMNTVSDYMLKEGDINNYHNDGYVYWGGLFSQWEYKTDKLSSFINLTVANSGYQRADYIYLNKDKKNQERDGYTYKTIDDNKVEFTPWKWFPGYTAKGGANYNFTKTFNAFFNLGHLNKAPRFNNVFYYDNVILTNIKNEIVDAVELGVSYSSHSFSVNLNSYYTYWKNRPVDYPSTIKIDDEEYSVNINGMNALHKGLELDFVYKVTNELEIQGLVSLGDWKWDTADSARIYDDNQRLVQTRFYDAKGVHVGNSAQTQVAGEVRWEPIKGLYLKPKATFFANYYAEFDPISLNGSPSSYTWYDDATGEHGSARDSWKIPSYLIVDFHAGYRFKLLDQRFQLRINVLNVMNKKRIIRAQNNDQYIDNPHVDFDAKSAAVFFGLGRTYNMSLKMSF